MASLEKKEIPEDLDEICMRHLEKEVKVPYCFDECQHCKIDEYNKNCPRYIPFKLFYVKEKGD
ncbi:MAG: hypothetical protein ABIB71_08770 [Candidatus Woesearchaeota archaeon]